MEFIHARSLPKPERGFARFSRMAVRSLKTLHRHCCVPFCLSDDRRDSECKLSFHTFPSGKKLRKQWIHNIWRDEGPNFQITRNTFVCSSHFLPADFKKSLTGLMRNLKPGSVPTLFNFIHAKIKKKRASAKKRVLQSKAMADGNTCDDTLSSSAVSGNLHLQEGFAVANPCCSSDHEYATQPLSAEESLEAARKRIEELEHLLESEKKKSFCLQNFAGNDKKIKKYTGSKNYQVFLLVFKFLQPTAEKMIRWSQVSRNGDINKCTITTFHLETLSLIDQFFLFMTRIKIGFDEETLADLFTISQPTVSRILITWVNYLYVVMAAITVWLTKQAVQANMPECLKAMYPNCRVILVCTEIRVQTPSSKVLNSMTYSHYKDTTTYKSVVGISPCGTAAFVSSLYTGSISDKDLCVRSKLLGLMKEGDDVMVDKGFVIQDLLATKRANLVIPPFLGKGEQFLASEVILTQDNARLGVHVERAIRRIKEFRILQQVVPLIITCSASQLWTVCALMTNFRGQLY